MAYSDTPFSEQLDQVKDQFQDLSTTLEEVCENLKKPGSPPPPEILEEIINSANNIFKELKSCVTEWAKSAQMPDIPDAQDLDSIKAIMTFSKKIVSHQHLQDEENEKVLADINRALSIEHAEEGESFEGLEQFRRDLNNLKSRVSTPPVSDKGQNDRTQILKNKHLINDLFTLLECEDTLDDKRHSQIYEIISKKYGRTFASAATRGNLIFTEIIDTEVPQPLPPDTREKPDEPEPERADDLPIDEQAEVQQEKTESEDVPDKDGIVPEVATEDNLPSEIHPDSSDESDASDVEGIQLTSAEKIEVEIAVALEQGRFGIAYHLARATPGVLPGSQAVKFVASNYVTDENSPVAPELPSNLAERMMVEVPEILNQKPNLIQHSYAALITSASLASALIAPGEPVAQLLDSLEFHLGDMPSLRTLAQTVAETSRTGVYISVEQLHGGDSFKQWTQDAQALQKKGEDWIGDERQSRIHYAPANRVWHRILAVWEEENRPSIGRLFELLSEPVEKIDIKAIASVVRHWRQNDAREIANIDQAFRPAQAVPNPIDGNAHASLMSKIKEALDFADHWDKLLKGRPNEGQGFDTKVVNKLRNAVHEHGENALLEVVRLKTPIARRAQNLVQHYLDKFKDADSQVPDSLRLRDLLNGDLLADPSVQLDNTGRPKDPVETELLLRLAKQDEPDFQIGIMKRAEDGDFLGAYEALDFVERSRRLGEEDIAHVRNKVEDLRSLVVQEIETKSSTTGDRLDVAYARGILTAEEKDELRGWIPNADFSVVDNFKQFFDALDFVSEQIFTANQKRRDELNQRLSPLENVPPEAEKRIEEAIQHSRFIVAEDYIERIEHNDALPESETETRSFDHFFPEFVKKYADFQNETSDAITRIKDALKHRECAGPVDATHLSDDTVLNGLGLIDAWLDLYTNMNKMQVKNFMRKFGFKDVDVTLEQPSFGERVFTLEVGLIADRRKAQLPDFGSRARGRYRLVAIHNRFTADTISQAAGEWSADGHPPNIVLFFNFLDEAERRLLAQQFGSGELRPTVVLDDALVTFLAMRPADQWIGTFFDCASAFTFAQPFDPNAAEVPPEMFFGRKNERDKIVAMGVNMTHFVYGGRRLGKTALLMDIAREYQSRGSDQLGLFLSLRGLGIGVNQPTDKLWSLFAKELAQYSIVVHTASRFETIADSVKRWLEESKERRILFLVDEADAFLAADRELRQGQRYRVLEQLKRLMDDTERRFKVVFAGLHNVQRTARDPNTPFAQLGDPVRIGPMLPETDPNEINNLIRDPLEALGYRFTSDDSLIHIAAAMNYYPALVQQFCKDLLNRLCVTRSDKGPPYEICPEVVDEVFGSAETRDRIRNLFSWTIQLDPRYEFLTYLIAGKSFGDNDARINSVPFNDIVEEALNEKTGWPQGFELDSSYEMFEVLLDEMVGLGILREVAGKESKEFTIRTRNLRMLLGRDDEIARRFSDAKNLRPPSKPDPSQFRRILCDGRLSSLTAVHEDMLFSSKSGVGLIFGTYLAGLDRVRESLEEVKTQELSLKLYDTDVASLDSQLHQVAQGRAPGVHIVFVDVHGVGNTDLTQLIKEALEFVGGLQSSQRTIRPVFLGGPSEAWAWLESQADPSTQKAELWEIWLKPCAKGFAHAWLLDQEANAHEDLQRHGGPSICALWPVVVEAAAGRPHIKTMAEATNLALDNGAIVSDVHDVPVVKRVLRLLSDLHPNAMTTDMFSDPELVEDQGNQVSMEEASRIFDWASRLGVVRGEKKNGYCLDTAYAMGLKMIFEE